MVLKRFWETLLKRQSNRNVLDTSSLGRGGEELDLSCAGEERAPFRDCSFGNGTSYRMIWPKSKNGHNKSDNYQPKGLPGNPPQLACSKSFQGTKKTS